MDDDFVLSLLEGISGSDSLRKSFLDAFQVPAQQDDMRNATTPLVVPNHLPSIHGEDQLTANECHSGSNALLVANVHQPKRVSVGASML